MSEVHVLYGPPGTGKTESLLSIVRMHIKEGVSPDQICFIAFTKKAANEAVRRACGNLNLEEEQIPWFRTLHSLAFRILNMNRTRVMGLGDYIKLAEQLGLSITYKSLNEDGTFAMQTRGDRLFFAEAMSRSRMLTLKEYWESIPGEDLYWYELKLVSDTLAKYKQEHDKVDFTDLIYQFIDTAKSPDVDVLIIDEAQDLTPLQWKMVWKMIGEVPRTYIAGDDDQAIFRWAGADVDQFINMPADSREVLSKSFRVPAEIQQLANCVVARIQKRVPKTWEPRGAIGTVSYVGDLSQIDMSTGRWLLLARNAYLLDTYTNHCVHEGFLFEKAGESPVSLESLNCIRIWETLRRGEQISVVEARLLYDMLSPRVGVHYGFKTKITNLPDKMMLTMEQLKNEYGLIPTGTWDVALDKMPSTEREYFIAAQNRGEDVKNPRIKISTIHGAKGGEAENVILQTDMAQRTWNESQENPDDEHRVWYVGITRAKENLFIMSPRTQMCYEI